MAEDTTNNMDNMLKKLKDYEPEKNPRPLTSNQRLVLGIFGVEGVGKSSFVNSVLSLFFGEEQFVPAEIAPAHSQESHTLCRNLYTLTNGMVLVDNRGFQELDSDEVIKEIQEQLDGNRGYTLNVCPGQNSTKVTREPVHVAIYVVSAVGYKNPLRSFGYQMIKKMKECQGRSPLAVITHVDCEQANTEDTKAYLNSIGIYNSSIFLIRNITEDHKELEEQYKLSLIELLGKCTNEGNWVMAFKKARLEDLEEQAQKEKDKNDHEVLQKTHDLKIRELDLMQKQLDIGEPRQNRNCIIL